MGTSSSFRVSGEELCPPARECCRSHLTQTPLEEPQNLAGGSSRPATGTWRHGGRRGDRDCYPSLKKKKKSQGLDLTSRACPDLAKSRCISIWGGSSQISKPPTLRNQGNIFAFWKPQGSLLIEQMMSRPPYLFPLLASRRQLTPRPWRLSPQTIPGSESPPARPRSPQRFSTISRSRLAWTEPEQVVLGELCGGSGRGQGVTPGLAWKATSAFDPGARHKGRLEDRSLGRKLWSQGSFLTLALPLLASLHEAFRILITPSFPKGNNNSSHRMRLLQALNEKTIIIMLKLLCNVCQALTKCFTWSDLIQSLEEQGLPHCQDYYRHGLTEVKV